MQFTRKVTHEQPRILIVSGKQFYNCPDGYYSYGGTVKEYNNLGEVFNLCVLNPVTKAGEPPEGWEKLNKNIAVVDMGKITFFHNLPSISAMWKSFSRTITVCRAWNPDAVVCKGPREEGFVAVFAARVSGNQPIILHYSYNWMPLDINCNGGFLRKFIRRCYREIIDFYKRIFLRRAGTVADYIACVSEDFRAQLSQVCSVPKNDILLLQTYFTLADAYFKVPPPDLNVTNLTLVYIGRLDLNKNVITLLKALVLYDQEIGLNLIIVGDGPEKDKLEDAVKALGLSEKVSFLGRVSNNEISSILAKSLALVLPSFSEGLPKVILEAFAAGRCVLGSRGEGVASLVKDNQTGYLFDPGNPEELAGCIGKIVNNPLHSVLMGKNARIVAESYRPHIAKANWSEIMDMIIDNKMGDRLRVDS